MPIAPQFSLQGLDSISLLYGITLIHYIDHIILNGLHEQEMVTALDLMVIYLPVRGCKKI